MPNFLKAGIEFNNLAKAMNGMNVMIQEVILKIESSSNKSECSETVILLAYIARKSVWNRIEQFNWPMDKEIITVPTISRSRITVTYALMQTIGKVSMLADELDIADEVQEIMDGGDAFFEIEKEIPDHIKKTF